MKDFNDQMARTLRRALPAAVVESMTTEEIARCAHAVARAALALTKAMPLRAQAHLKEVAIKHGLTPSAITGPSRHRDVVEARREFIQRLRADNMGTPTIGRILRRDHTTILHHLKAAA